MVFKCELAILIANAAFCFGIPDNPNFTFGKSSVSTNSNEETPNCLALFSINSCVSGYSNCLDTNAGTLS